MEYALVGVVALAIIVAVAAFSKQLGVAAPLVLVVVGVGLSYLPGLSAPIVVPSWVILSLVLPPLLYSAAIQTPLMDFRRNLGSITLLSVVLVIVTALVIGFGLSAMVPGINLGVAIALGAIVSPTDAVAATAVAKRLGLPSRLVAVLEGESLVNDASALVLLKAAIGAAGVGISFWSVAGDFAYSVVVAIGFGFVVGLVTVFVRARLKDSMLETAVSFMIPFVAYIPTESLGASGVLAVVVAGLYTGHSAPRYFTPQARISERLNWRTIQFILENGVFLLMGIQLKTIVESVHGGELDVPESIGIGLLICVALLVVRTLFVVPLILRLRANQRQAARAEPRFSSGLERLRGAPAPTGPRSERWRAKWVRLLERKEADLTDLLGATIGWRAGAVLSWAGMRGVVTLAAAQSLPVNTPLRPQLILIAFTVAITTLLVQGGTLPWVIRATGIRGTDAVAEQRELADLLQEISESAVSVLNTPSLELEGEDEIDPAIVERVKQDTLIGSAALAERVSRTENETPGPGPHDQYLALRAEVITAQREALLEARSRGSYSSAVLSRAQSFLDLEESRIGMASAG